MKTAIIIVLFVLLLAGAFLSRPSQADFNRYMTEQTTGKDTNFLKVSWDKFQADQFVQGCTFKDRLLWVDVQKDGKTVYTGAFGHWFNHATIANDVKAVQQKA
ncbi:MAG TPA: hypothetical protein VGI81_00330 [Tepidisphaeraceae bacterium]|jgi:hypothetical protein